jgi:hypothetical protein
MIELTLRYTGGLADQNFLEFYDAARALSGFQRSLAIATHLALNGEIITQAPALKGAKILTQAPSEGSFKSKAWIILGGAVTLGSVGSDSPVGQVITSIYDYMLSETMGFHVDYSKTLQVQYHDHLEKMKITEEKLDSAMEKSESGINDMHRPIYASKTATMADIHVNQRDLARKLGPDMSIITYEYIAHTSRDSDAVEIYGVVSSYNINTFRGRFFSFEHQRPIPFELMENARTEEMISLIARSLTLNAVARAAKRNDPNAYIEVVAHKLESSTGKLKSLHIVKVSELSLL